MRGDAVPPRRFIGLRTLAKEWGRYRVNVNCVAFGFINTRLTQPVGEKPATIEKEGKEIAVGVQPQLWQMMEQMIPLGRVGTPRRGRRPRVSFLHAESNYISGQVIVCGGGLLL